MSGPPSALSSPCSLPAPLGGTLVERIGLEALGIEGIDLREWPTLELSARSLADLEMLATGAYSPLTGFLGWSDYQSVLQHMRLSSGLPWSIPITLSVSREQARQLRAGMVVLRHQGQACGLLEVQEQYDVPKQREAQAVYGTTDAAHVGVAALYAAGEVNLAGPVTLLELRRGPFAGAHYTPAELRALMQQRGWRSVAAFQTRNPIHRAHEYLHKVALELVDGLLIHPLVGHTKQDDVSPQLRMQTYEALLGAYYPPKRTLLSVYPAAMRYAGPREALLHALSRRNYGATHFIVGRDHAGVGGYYSPMAAQEIFGAFDAAELGIQVLCFEEAFYCSACGQMATTRSCPHEAQYHHTLSGSELRRRLQAGLDLPPYLTRPEVAALLQAAAQERESE